MEVLILHVDCNGEALGIASERADCKTNYYLTNPAFDRGCKPKCDGEASNSSSSNCR